MHHAQITRLASLLRIALTVGVLAVLLLPAARDNTPLGFLPLWLIAMPASALWALRRVRAG
ncbi:hypothetical protein LF41_1853 [Lysobacter dokdonensis DS-58]|uniref:Transmembrane protein n=1 Tax=Lysobacter dokdonensis DS-58 TaxID=1300345 RepID=A0A0A2WYA5_9GAMM|nr:hypothetical protein [Lysobacter dokdonensis]KGQ17999.1 hypothetical protein LF41_1853 [Lysobacter dokdonensis DS-58]